MSTRTPIKPAAIASGPVYGGPRLVKASERAARAASLAEQVAQREMRTRQCPALRRAPRSAREARAMFDGLFEAA